MTRQALNGAAAGQSAAPSQDWLYSPHPALNAAIADIRNRHPQMYPDMQRTFDFLQRIGNPQHRLPHVFHVAGTNGKGSTLAFIQAILEAAGLSVHKYIGPHLVRFEERFTFGGREVASEDLLSLIRDVDRLNGGAPASFFEFFTGLFLHHAAQEKADAVLLETGVGGLLDATNVVAKDLTAILTRISFDHMKFLGSTIEDIARHKAGIIKQAMPVVIAAQPEQSAMRIFEDTAQAMAAAPKIGSRDWHVIETDRGFEYQSGALNFMLPLPALPGRHQLENAGAAITAVANSPFADVLTQKNLQAAMANVIWPARLQRIIKGYYADILPQGWELWIDGAHNDSGAQVLAAQMEKWGHEKPIHLVTSMKQQKECKDFYPQLFPHVRSIQVMEALSAVPMMPAAELCDQISAMGFAGASPCPNLESAIAAIAFQFQAPQRIVVAGSLYLAGHILRHNG